MDQDTEWVLENFPMMAAKGEDEIGRLVRAAKDDTGMVRLYVLVGGVFVTMWLSREATNIAESLGLAGASDLIVGGVAAGVAMYLVMLIRDGIWQNRFRKKYAGA